MVYFSFVSPSLPRLVVFPGAWWYFPLTNPPSAQELNKDVAGLTIMAFPCNQFGAQEPGGCCVNDHAHKDGRDMCFCISRSYQPYEMENLDTEKNIKCFGRSTSKSIKTLCVRCLLWALVNITRFGEDPMDHTIPLDLTREDPTWIGKIHQRQNKKKN